MEGEIDGIIDSIRAQCEDVPTGFEKDIRSFISGLVEAGFVTCIS